MNSGITWRQYPTRGPLATCVRSSSSVPFRDLTTKRYGRQFSGAKKAVRPTSRTYGISKGQSGKCFPILPARRPVQTSRLNKSRHRRGGKGGSRTYFWWSGCVRSRRWLASPGSALLKTSMKPGVRFVCRYRGRRRCSPQPPKYGARGSSSASTNRAFPRGVRATQKTSDAFSRLTRDGGDEDAWNPWSQTSPGFDSGPFTHLPMR